MSKTVLAGLAAAAVVAVLLSPFASPFPDGLEKIAEEKGFMRVAEGKEAVQSLLPDYTVPGIAHEGLSTALAGLAGTLATFGATLGLGYIIRKRK